MFRQAGKWLIVVALVVSTGGHWIALQSVAWFTMAVNFAHTQPLSVALSKTFDGKHPCRLCKTVEEGRKSEQQEATLKVETKLELCLNRQGVTLPPAPPAEHSTCFLDFFSTRSDTPPRPPPRLS